VKVLAVPAGNALLREADMRFEAVHIACRGRCRIAVMPLSCRPPAQTGGFFPPQPVSASTADKAISKGRMPGTVVGRDAVDIVSICTRRGLLCPQKRRRRLIRAQSTWSGGTTGGRLSRGTRTMSNTVSFVAGGRVVLRHESGKALR